MEKIITQCPHCSKKYKLTTDKVGKKIRCPNCKEVFAVQEVAVHPKAAPKPPAPAAPARPRPSKPQAAAPARPAAKASPPPAAKQPFDPAAQGVISLSHRPLPLTVKDFMETLHMRFIPEKAQGADIHLSYTFVEKGKQPEYWTVKIKDGTCEITEGPDPSARSQVKMKHETYLKIATEQLDTRVAFFRGKMKIKGDRSSLSGFRECLQKTGLKDWK